MTKNANYNDLQSIRDRKEFLEHYRVELTEWAPPVCVGFLVIMIFLSAMINYRVGYMGNRYKATQENLTQALQSVSPVVENTIDGTVIGGDFDDSATIYMDQAPKSQKMEEVYAMNEDTIGWLKIDGMVIDYPVMQTPFDEQYYLNRDFDGNYSAYGCILADTDSCVGSGTYANDYNDGTRPSTNIILHGHNMKNGTMFGDLDKFRDKNFTKEHSIIKFSSLYEDREYEIMSVFLSQVYLKSQTDVFKYYQFFEAENEEAFDDFYTNVKSLQLYDTGVTAEYGDEFLTLSVCAYHVDNGRLVVVAKRTK